MELTRIKELKARGTLAATVELSGDLYRTIIAELEQAQRGRDAALRRAKAEVWPKVNAPAMYEHPDPGWVDTAVPDLTRIWELAREVGYAVGLHGSLKRDMDLIAAPWTDEAIGNAGLIDHLCAGLPAVRIGGPEYKSHGRVAVTLQMDGYFKPIDLSIMPRLDARAAQIEEGE